MILQEILTALGFNTQAGGGADSLGNLKTGTAAGDVIVQALGKGLRIKGAGVANGRVGQNAGPMVAGDLVVGNTTVDANTIVLLIHRGDGGNVGALYENRAGRVNGVSFEVKSTNGADVGHFDYLLLEAI